VTDWHSYQVHENSVKLVCVCVCVCVCYVAPEILKGERCDMPADMWTIGVITYVL